MSCEVSAARRCRCPSRRSAGIGSGSWLSTLTASMRMSLPRRRPARSSSDGTSSSTADTRSPRSSAAPGDRAAGSATPCCPWRRAAGNRAARRFAGNRAADGLQRDAGASRVRAGVAGAADETDREERHRQHRQHDRTDALEQRVFAPASVVGFAPAPFIGTPSQSAGRTSGAIARTDSPSASRTPPASATAARRTAPSLVRGGPRP